MKTIHVHREIGLSTQAWSLKTKSAVCNVYGVIGVIGMNDISRAWKSFLSRIGHQIKHKLDHQIKHKFYRIIYMWTFCHSILNVVLIQNYWIYGGNVLTEKWVWDLLWIPTKTKSMLDWGRGQLHTNLQWFFDEIQEY